VQSTEEWYGALSNPKRALGGLLGSVLVESPRAARPGGLPFQRGRSQSRPCNYGQSFETKERRHYSVLLLVAVLGIFFLPADEACGRLEALMTAPEPRPRAELDYYGKQQSLPRAMHKVFALSFANVNQGSETSTRTSSSNPTFLTAVLLSPLEYEKQAGPGTVGHGNCISVLRIFLHIGQSKWSQTYVRPVSFCWYLVELGYRGLQRAARMTGGAHRLCFGQTELARLAPKKCRVERAAFCFHPTGFVNHVIIIVRG
jgi:hypothetical protein